MPYEIVAPPEVWAGFASIPDHGDREEARAIVEAISADPYALDASPEPYEHAGAVWLVYQVVLSSGRGFVSYSPFFTDAGTAVVRLWPIVWADV